MTQTTSLVDEPPAAHAPAGFLAERLRARLAWANRMLDGEEGSPDVRGVAAFALHDVPAQLGLLAQEPPDWVVLQLLQAYRDHRRFRPEWLLPDR